MASPHDKKHSIISNSDHIGIPSVAENTIVTFDTNGLIKDSGLILNDSSAESTALLSAKEIDSRIEEGTLASEKQQEIVGYFFSNMSV